MKFGKFEIKSFVESNIRLDGGAMFGVVPKSMWSKLITPDENNLIKMCNNFFILKAHGKNIVLDCGLGDTISEKEGRIYNYKGDSLMSSGFESVGLSEDDIDYVILTHLHTDHMAGTVKKVDGQFVPRFPNAKVFASKLEFQAAMNPNERTAAIYKPDRVDALKNGGVLELIEGNEELFPGVQGKFTAGHSAGHFGLEIESDGERVFFYSDILSVSQHLPLPYIAALDIDPLSVLETKRKLLPEILKDNTTMLFVHDTEYPIARVKQHDKKFILEKVSVIKDKVT